MSNGSYRRLATRLLFGCGLPLGPEDNVEDDAVVVGVGMVAVAVPIGRFKVKLNIAGYWVARLGGDDSVAEVRALPWVGSAGIDYPEGPPVFGDQPFRQGMCPLPEGTQDALRGRFMNPIRGAGIRCIDDLFRLPLYRCS